MSLVLACWTPKKGYMLGDRACVDEDRVWKGITPKVRQFGKVLVGVVGDYAAADVLEEHTLEEQNGNAASAVNILRSLDFTDFDKPARKETRDELDVEILACGPDGLFLMGADGVIAAVGASVYGIGAGGDMAFGYCMGVDWNQQGGPPVLFENAACFVSDQLSSVRPPFDILEVEW